MAAANEDADNLYRDTFHKKNSNKANWKTYFNRAIKYKGKDADKALKNLGFALHMVQDSYAHRTKVTYRYGNDNKKVTTSIGEADKNLGEKVADNQAILTFRIKNTEYTTRYMVELFKKKKKISSFSKGSGSKEYTSTTNNGKKLTSWNQYWFINGMFITYGSTIGIVNGKPK